MEIIKHYWGNTEEGLNSEKKFSEHLKNHEITKVFIGLKEIETFKISTEENRMILLYSLVKNKSLKYYKTLLNCSIAVNKNVAVFLEDKNWQNYTNQILTKETITILNN